MIVLRRQDGRNFAQQQHEQRGNGEGDPNNKKRVGKRLNLRLAVCEQPLFFERNSLTVDDVAASSRRKFCADLMLHRLHGSIGCIQMLGKSKKMQIRPVVQDRSANSDADCAAEIAHHVEQSARVFEPVRRQAAEAEIHGRRDGEHLWKSPQKLRQKKFSRAPIVRDEAEIPHGQSKKREAEHHHPARVEFFRQRDVNRNSDLRGRARGCDRDAGLPCVIATITSMRSAIALELPEVSLEILIIETTGVISDRRLTIEN